MDAKDILTIIFSSTLITTTITVVFNLLASKKKDAIENITKERKEWRNQLRTIARAIQESKDMEQLHLALCDLKVRINAYGMAKNSLFCDTHFWMQINRLECGASLSVDEFKRIKIGFVNQISCLLKYDWERSKAEIKGNAQTRIVIISLAIGFFLYSVRWFCYYSAETDEIDSYFLFCFCYSVYVAFSMLVMYAADKWTEYFWYRLYHGFLIVLSFVVFCISCICVVFIYRSGTTDSSDIFSVLICLSPCTILLQCAKAKLDAYNDNARDFILASAISGGYDVIDQKYEVFFLDAPPVHIYTNKTMKFVDSVDLSSPKSGLDTVKPD